MKGLLIAISSLGLLSVVGVIMGFGHIVAASLLIALLLAAIAGNVAEHRENVRLDERERRKLYESGEMYERWKRD